MTDLKTSYLGLELKNPVIVGSCGLTNSVENIKKLEENGAGAVVLKSIFEEQISMEIGSFDTGTLEHTEGYDYISEYTKQHNLNKYIKLIKELKKEVSIPVIASINCITSGEWASFAETIQSAGADALELNIFILPGDFKNKGENIERIYFDIIKNVEKKISIPFSIKISSYFSGLANTIFNLSLTSVSGIVLFNRFYNPDIDIDKLEVVSAGIYSSQSENAMPLRWIGILSDHAKCDLVSSTGVHNGKDVVKNILVGAKAVQVVTSIYKNGPEYIKTILNEIEEWMREHNYSTLNDFRGKLSRDKVKDPQVFERVQFMKYFSS
ncbi:MAG: dihydroorotate dehydrogenase-like protein [Acidobacteriota bacterium]